MHIRYFFSKELRTSYRNTVNLIANPQTAVIDESVHEKNSSVAVNNYKLQKIEIIDDIYKPGQMWDAILATVDTYTRWKESSDDTVLKDSLRMFYRTDLVIGHSGDAYLWELKNGVIDLRLQVFMVIRRFNEFLQKDLLIDKKNITTTDIGGQMYTEFRGHNLTFKLIRHAYYLNRLKQCGLVKESPCYIGELGSGSGEMAILTMKTYPQHKYVCFDLPETLMVSSYNILMTFPDRKIGLFDQFKSKDKITRQDIEQYDIVLLPNWCIERVDVKTFDIFVNIGSLGEMDLPIIQNYIRNIERICSGHFYTVNRNVSTAKEFGVCDVPLNKYPFSKNVEIIHDEYDIASDIYHSTYGMNYQCNYWEYIIRMKEMPDTLKAKTT